MVKPLYLIYLRFRHFRNKLKSEEWAFLILPAPGAYLSLNKPKFESKLANLLANDSGR